MRATPPGRDVVLTANSGHELGHTGLDAFLAARPGSDRPGGASWVHYGANIGAAGGQLFIQCREDDPGGRPHDRRSFRRCFVGLRWNIEHRASVNRMAEKSVVPNGETRDIHKAGGHYVTLVGSNKLFHLPQDRFPDAVDVAGIARIAAGSAAAVVALSR